MASSAFRHRRRVVAGWILFLVVAVVGGSSLSGKYVADYATPGSDSKAAATVLAQQYGGRTDQTVDIVYHDTTSVTSTDVAAPPQRPAHQAGALPGLQSGVTVSQAEISPDGRTGDREHPAHHAQGQGPVIDRIALCWPTPITSPRVG